jgi:hypothetical protein
MTPPELLEELKQVDPETYEALRNYPLYVSGDEALSVDLPGSRNQTLCEDAIQGCIQRACERRGWGLVIERSKDSGPYEWSAYTGHEEPPGAFRAAYSWGIRYYGGSAAEALLAAYVAAIKEEKR